MDFTCYVWGVCVCLILFDYWLCVFFLGVVLFHSLGFGGACSCIRFLFVYRERTFSLKGEGRVDSEVLGGGKECDQNIVKFKVCFK